MSFKIEVTSIRLFGTDKNGNAIFEASGTRLNTAVDLVKVFHARTIQWKGEPIFKITGAGRLSESTWTRGERIAIAKACKAARIEKFGEGHKERITPDLAKGQIVHISA